MHYLSIYPGVALIALGLTLFVIIFGVLLRGEAKAGWPIRSIDSEGCLQFHPAGSRWPAGQSPLDLFDEGSWLACANTLMVCLHDLDDRRMTQDSVADQGILRELMLLEAGVGSKTTLEDLREEVEIIESAHALQGAVVLGGMV